MKVTSPNSGQRLSLLLITWLGVTVGTIVLAPFRFGSADTSRLAWIPPEGALVADLLLNVVLFLPLGFLLHRLSAGRVGVRRIAMVAAAFSLGIEVAQIFLPNRYPTASDVVANCLGGGLGALASRSLRATLGEGSRLLGRTLLDLPLTGLCYLLVPWLWLVGLGSGADPVRLWMLLPLALAGGFAWAGAARSSAPQDGRIGRYLIPIVAGWGIIVAAPALSAGTTIAVSTIAAAIAAAVVAEFAWRRGHRAERRIEPRVLRLVAPLLIIALLGMPYEGDLLAVTGSDSRVEMLRWLERIAGFLVLGYVIAEWRGRLAEPLRRSSIGPLIGAVLVVIGEQALSGSGSPIGAALSGMAAAFVGGSLYHLSRIHVLYLLGQPTS
jgi:VanZ family protein